MLMKTEARRGEKVAIFVVCIVECVRGTKQCLTKVMGVSLFLEEKSIHSIQYSTLLRLTHSLRRRNRAPLLSRACCCHYCDGDGDGSC